MEQEIWAAPSVDLLILAFDYAVAACAARDVDKVSKSLTLLEQSLNPRAFPELGHSLARIYRFCRVLLQRQDFEGVLSCLRTLRTAWMEVKARV